MLIVACLIIPLSIFGRGSRAQVLAIPPPEPVAEELLRRGSSSAPPPSPDSLCASGSRGGVHDDPGVLEASMRSRPFGDRCGPLAGVVPFLATPSRAPLIRLADAASMAFRRIRPAGPRSDASCRAPLPSGEPWRRASPSPPLRRRDRLCESPGSTLSPGRPGRVRQPGTVSPACPARRVGPRDGVGAVVGVRAGEDRRTWRRTVLSENTACGSILGFS